MSAAGTAFDAIAASYDTLWNTTAVGISQREAVWRRVESLFSPSDFILDLGCGTGEDALHFESRGVQVFAIDASSAMVSLARQRGVNAYRRTVEAIATLEGEFNGVLSNFGVLNCVEDLASVASELSRLVLPGGFIAICVMSSFCLWETLHFLVRGRARQAFRRLTPGKVRTSFGVDVCYLSSAELKRAFRDGFKLIGQYGVGVCVPPSYVRGLGAETIALLSRLDRCLEHLPVFRAIADHRLFIFKRV